MIITLEQAKDSATIIAALLGLATIIKGVVEYVRQGVERRAERFVAMRVRLYGNEKFREICVLLDSEDARLREIPRFDRYEYLGLLEDVALMLNSGLIRPSVAHYMFGYFAIRCWRSEHFWHDIARDSSYWALFEDFVIQMQEIEKDFVYDRSALKF